MEEKLEKIKKEINSLKKQLEAYGDSIRIKDVIVALNRIYYIDEPITVLNNTDNSVNTSKNSSSNNSCILLSIFFLFFSYFFNTNYSSLICSH